MAAARNAPTGKASWSRKWEGLSRSADIADRLGMRFYLQHGRVFIARDCDQMRLRYAPKLEFWVVDERDDPATFPGWLSKAVKNRFEGGLFVLTSDAGVIEARHGDLIVSDGERISVNISQDFESRTVGLFPFPSRADIVATLSRAPLEKEKSVRSTPAPIHGAVPVLALALFLGLLAFGLAWLMIRLIADDRMLYCAVSGRHNCVVVPD